MVDILIQVLLVVVIPLVIVWGYLGLVQYLDNRGKISEEFEFYWVLGYVLLFLIYALFIFPEVNLDFLVRNK